MSLYLQRCSNYGTSVRPMLDGTCPSCRVKSFPEGAFAEGTAPKES